MSSKGLIRPECSVCERYKTCLDCINFYDDSECSLKAEQRKIKQEVKKNDCDTQSDY